MKVVVVLLFGLTLCFAGPTYRYRGWRPPGASFNPTASQIQPQRYYGPPSQSLTTTARPTTTERAIPTTTTTERSREPTTPTVTIGEGSSEEDEFEQQNPALAIANSFAFNRPIYVYNAGFPFQTAAFTLLQ